MKAVLVISFLGLFLAAQSQDSTGYTNKEVIYGRKDGMALTMVVLTPTQQAKGKAIISVVSGNWISSYRMLPTFTKRAQVYTSKGYTMFLVIHGSQPRYTIIDETEDIKRAVRFIRYNAGEYGIDSSHIGITGLSSGGHLSLMVALGDDKMNSRSGDPVDKVSSRVQAAAVFYPPTDFLNWGAENTGVQRQALIRARVAAAFDFKTMNESSGVYESIREDSTAERIAKEMSPANNVSADDPPVLIAHGDADRVVPLQQSQLLVKKLTAAGVTNELIIKPGGNHGWMNSEEQDKEFIKWFDKYLK